MAATRLPCPWDSLGKNTGVGCHFLLQCMKVKSESEVSQSCPTLSDPMDCSQPGCSVRGIFQAIVLQWVATAALSNSMKLWAVLCRATKMDGSWWRVLTKMWSIGEGNGKPLRYSCLENPMNSMKRQKDMTWKDELPRSVGTQYATREQWRNNSRKNETESQRKQYSVVDVTGDRRKVRCCKSNTA